MSQDLDLTEVDSSDLDKLGNEIESFFSKDTSQKNQLAFDWERNHQMLDGNQWIEFDGARETGGMWRRLQVTQSNEYIPRPVTNYLFDAYQTLKGYLLKNDPRLTVRPNSRSNKDKTAAKIAELISEVNWERLREDYNYEYAASALLTYGTVFKKDYWDSSFASLIKVPKMEQRPAIDPNTGQPSGQMQEVQVTDPMTGQPMFDELPLGDVQTAVIEPYSMALDPLAKNLHDARWIMEYSIKPLTWIKENFDKQEEGYTGKAIEVEEEKSLPNSLKRFYQLATSSGVRNSGGVNLGANGSGGDSGMIDKAAIIKEYYSRPDSKNPKGRLVVVADKKVLYSGPSPYEGPEQGDWHPYSECRWEILPGRFFGKSPLDNATEIQKQINSIDSVITLTRKTMAVPQKLVPKGSLPRTTQWTGRPGQVIEYTPNADGAPQQLQAMGVHEQVFQERSQKVEDIKNITGAIDILKGDRPPGVTAHSALALLFEVGTGKLHPIMKRWRMFIESSQKKQLKLVSKKYREPRPEFIRSLLMKNKDLTAGQLQQFVGTDLYDNCNVTMEASSSIPKLHAALNAQLMELAPLGVLNLENPKNRAEFLSRLGIDGFDTDTTSDVARAEDENDKMDNILLNPEDKPVMLQQDNHDVHISVIDERMKKPSFAELPQESQQAYLMHREEHQTAKDDAMHQQMMQALMTGQPPPEQEQNPMQGPGESIKPGKGNSKEVQNAMHPDLLGATPGGNS